MLLIYRSRFSSFLIGIIFLLCYSKVYESDVTERWREEK